MKHAILYSLLVIAALDTSAQQLSFSQPEEIGPEVNTDDEELAPMLAPDGHTLYFSRAFHSKNTGGKYTGTDIWISRKDSEGNWMPAVNAGKPWNNKRANAVIGISADGKTVYLSNAYNNKSGIAFSTFVNGRWTKPDFVPVPGINRDDFVGVYVHPDFDVMMISMRGKDSYGEEDLYVSVKDSLGNWNQPRNLGPAINTEGFEITPFLSADKRTLLFSSNQHIGYGGSDVFMAQRLYDSWDVWTKPQNVGNTVNSSAFDAYFTLQDSLVYFCSARSEGAAKVYRSSIQLKTDSLEQKVKSIINEAQSILSDLNKAGSDLATKNLAIRIYYPEKSIDMDSQGYFQLANAIEDARKHEVVEITLVAFSKEFSSAQLNSSISQKRMNRIIDAYRAVLGKGVTIKSEIALDSAFDTRACVEIRYLIK
jgi:hypothetical protein